MTAVRYFLYLSSAKLEMLHGQLPAQPAANSSVGIDVKVFKAERRSDRGEPSVYDKLARVEEWIYREEDVGTVATPGPWILHRGTVWAANFTPHSSISEVADLRSSAVLFSSQDEDGNVVLLGGSGTHVLGSPDYADRSGGRLYYSWAVSLLRLLEGYVEDLEVKVGFGPVPPSTDTATVAASCAAMSRGWMAREVGHCEFLAKRLFTGKHEGRTVTLGTPLYVAMMDE